MLKYRISDYIGKQYGHLTVIGQSKNSPIPNAFDFKCECGNIVSYAPDRVISGRQKSCGQCQFSNHAPNPRAPLQDYVGKKKHLLTVIGYSKSPQDKRWHLDCQCQCGNKCSPLPYQFDKETVKSCGCLKRNSPATIDKRTKHPLYGLWRQMIGRCENLNHPKYYRYGARGIKVCNEWHDFWKFVEWSNSIGGRPEGCTLDRIDNNGNYEPSNCRWATSFQQSVNKSSTRILEYNGEKKSIAEWSLSTGLSWDLIWNRISSGWAPEKALTTPLNENLSHKNP